MGQNWGAGAVPLGGGAGSASDTMLSYHRTKWPISVPRCILIHPAVWPQQTWAENWGALPPFGEGKLGPNLTQCCLGRGLPSYQVAC